MTQTHHPEEREQHVALPVPAGTPQQLGGTRRARAVEQAFLGVSVVFLLCVIAQVFLAGLAVFVTPVHWAQHTRFVHIFEFVPLLMLLLSSVGRLPVRLRWLSAAMFALVYVQYVTANIGAYLPFVSALHPVVALILFWLSLHVIQQTRQHLSMRGEARSGVTS